MDVLTLAILALATWRISAMLVRESGPFFIFLKLRELVGIRHDDNHVVLSVPEKFLAGLLSCVWCASVWVGAGWVALWWFLPRGALIAGSIFALSAIAIAYDHVLGGQNPP